MGSTSKDATQNRLGDHKPKNLFETSLWRTGMSMVWVAWIEWGQHILGTECLRRKIIRIQHRLTTHTSTLTMFKLDCHSQLNNLLPTLWCLHEFNVFARRHSRNGFLKQNTSHRPLFGSASHFANMGSWKAGSPASNPRRLNVAKSWISTILHWLAGVAIKAIKSCSPHLGYHNSIFCKHYATILSWWSVLPLSGTLSLW